MSWNTRFREIVDASRANEWMNASHDFMLSLSVAEDGRFLGELAKTGKLFAFGIADEFTLDNGDWRNSLKEWLDDANDLVVGYFSYDLKNRLEKLDSGNADSIGFLPLHLVVPRVIMFETEEGWSIYSHDSNPEPPFRGTYAKPLLGKPLAIPSKDEYMHRVATLQQHIQFGDIYEVNFCVQHGFDQMVVDPMRLYHELQAASPAPFSCYVADNGKYLMSSSPERFMKKRGQKITSQPMKGTNRKTAENELQKMALRNDAKEFAENVMITDLVRNDLSRSAEKGSVTVDELCGVYEFEHVNQMISTVSATLREDVHSVDALLNAFPMGSMTGAPKIRAMELIDQFEDFSRGLYSGAVGYFTPELDFDFNVIIRSILYNREKQMVTFPTGGAITINSDPEKEFEECMLKAEAMRNVLLNHAK